VRLEDAHRRGGEQEEHAGADNEKPLPNAT